MLCYRIGKDVGIDSAMLLMAATFLLKDAIPCDGCSRVTCELLQRYLFAGKSSSSSPASFNSDQQQEVDVLGNFEGTTISGAVRAFNDWVQIRKTSDISTM